ncbi:hypothetical protein C8Q70DRAFT_31810 [Cubamyces menziesii]|nr:hypothetical protein C8Q70DRAFT_31810 [Cubamyces menziesii]
MQQPCANIEASAAELYDYIRLNTYFALSAATIRGYYHVLTLEEEVDHYKATRITGSLVLYCANRYLPLPFFIYNLASLPFSLDRPRPIRYAQTDTGNSGFHACITAATRRKPLGSSLSISNTSPGRPSLPFAYTRCKGACPWLSLCSCSPSHLCWFAWLCCTGRPLQVQHIV